MLLIWYYFGFGDAAVVSSTSRLFARLTGGPKNTQQTSGGAATKFRTGGMN